MLNTSRSILTNVSEETHIKLNEMIGPCAYSLIEKLKSQLFANLIHEKYEEFCKKKEQESTQIPENICLSDD